MWPLLARCGILVNTSLVGSLAATASRTSACLFHVLANAGRRSGSALENQSANRLLLERPANQLLSPAVSPLLNLASGFKVKGRLKRRCQDCYFVVRHQRLFVICKTHRRHKQMSMKKHERNTWILTDATQGTARAW